MSQKWNLQDIRPARKKAVPTPPKHSEIVTHKKIDPEEAIMPTTSPTDTSSTYRRKPSQQEKRKKPRIVLPLIVLVVVISIGFLVNFFTGRAELIVYPKFKDVQVQGDFTASSQPQGNELGYELLVLENSAKKEVEAKGEENVAERAEGTIIVYNTKNDTSQRLIKNTRFESADGLIFRINESIEVPAIKKDAEGNIIPGSVTAKVFADAPGDRYNIEPTKFTVPGLKGSDSYDVIFAESKTAFTGGYEGKKYIIDDVLLKNTQNELHTEAKTALMKRLETEKPAGFVYYPQAVTFAYDSLPSTDSGNGKAIIEEKTRLQIPLFKNEELASYIAKQTIAGYENLPVRITDPTTLSFAYLNASTTESDLSIVPQISFSLSGTAQIVWQFDEDKLKSEVVSLSKTALPNVLSSYPAISRTETIIKPFWSHSMPDSTKKITITTKLE